MKLVLALHCSDFCFELWWISYASGQVGPPQGLEPIFDGQMIFNKSVYKTITGKGFKEGSCTSFDKATADECFVLSFIWVRVFLRAGFGFPMRRADQQKSGNQPINYCRLVFEYLQFVIQVTVRTSVKSVTTQKMTLNITGTISCCKVAVPNANWREMKQPIRLLYKEQVVAMVAFNWPST